jgi:hypothetical protein
MSDLPAITWPLSQTCVYWAPSSIDKTGAVTYAAAVEVACRWDDFTQEILSVEGDTILSMASVMVDQNVAINGYLWLGELADAPADPKADSTAHLIRQFMCNPNIDADEELKTARL